MKISSFCCFVLSKDFFFSLLLLPQKLKYPQQSLKLLIQSTPIKTKIFLLPYNLDVDETEKWKTTREKSLFMVSSQLKSLWSVVAARRKERETVRYDNETTRTSNEQGKNKGWKIIKSLQVVNELWVQSATDHNHHPPLSSYICEL